MRSDGSVEEYAVITALEVNAGDIIRLHTANGGGHGDPRRRSCELLQDDVRNGYVSDNTARSVYGADT
jgi:N-methylhydantoinase B